MPKQRPISDADKDLFRQAMKPVKPLSKHDRVPPIQAKKTVTRQPPSDFEPSLPIAFHPDDIHPDEWCDGDETISFKRDGIQQRLWQKFRRGQQSSEAHFDCHGLTAAEALNAVDRFVSHCQNDRRRYICIVHGKGRLSTGKPVLKNALNQWLRQHPAVLGFHSAQPKDGGSGALYVLLKTRKST